MSDRSSRGFTLIELLVVLVVVGMLVALSGPVVSQALASARQSACASNMRQIGLAMNQYAGDHGMHLPETSHTAVSGKTWIDLLAPYLGNLDEIRICPADPRGRERLQAKGTSYILNSFLFVPETDPFGEVIGKATNNLLHIKSPSQTMMAFVCSDRTGLGAGNDHTHSGTWSSWAAVTRDISPDRFTRGKKTDHSSGTSNYLYADGHVESLDASSIKKRVESGDNIALPR